ncbi:MAG: MogA/MoaB family molybdenum cofactor biosynthesis protein [Chloroflexota bacterium]
MADKYRELYPAGDLAAHPLRLHEPVERALAPLYPQVERYEVVPDDPEANSDRLARWADELKLDLIVTTGGTGLSPRDFTPEATLKVVERLAPGLVEAMRAAGRASTPHAMLSRAVAGTRGRSLIINLPGNPRAVTEGLEAIMPALPHAIEVLRGEARE